MKQSVVRRGVRQNLFLHDSFAYISFAYYFLKAAHQNMTKMTSLHLKDMPFVYWLDPLEGKKKY